MEKLNLPINELLDKLEQLKARNRDLLTIDEIESLDEAIFRLQSVRSGDNQIKMEDLIVLIKLLFEYLTDSDFLNNI
jgi:hypothetical protein